MSCTPLSAAIRALSTRKSVSGSAVMPSLTQRSDCTSVQTMPSSSLSWLPRTSFLNCLFVKSFSVGSLHLEVASALCPTSLHHPQVATFHHGALFVLGGGLFQTHFIPLRCCEQSMNRPFLSTHKCAPYATSGVWMWLYWSLTSCGAHARLHRKRSRPRLTQLSVCRLSAASSAMSHQVLVARNWFCVRVCHLHNY